MSSIFREENDLISYAKVVLFGHEHSGLLDSGAATSCIGGNLAKCVIESKIEIEKLSAFVTAASGSKQKVVGNILLYNFS